MAGTIATIDITAALEAFTFDPEEGDAWIHNGALYAKRCAAANERYLGAVGNTEEAEAEVQSFFTRLDGYGEPCEGRR